MCAVRKHFKKIFSTILSGILIATFLLDGARWMSSSVNAATAVTADNPIAFSLGVKKDPTVTNGLKYTIQVNDVFDNGSIAYKTIFVTYPQTLQLIAPATPPTGFTLNNNPITGVATLVIDVETNSGLTPAVVASTLNGYYFVLKTPNVLPPEGALVAISANTNKIAFYEDESGYLHYYQFFPQVTTWMVAYNNAKAKTMIDPFTGDPLQGYLTTITAVEEQRMVYNSIAKLCGWLGGTRMLLAGTNVKVTDQTSIPITTPQFNYTVAKDWYWANGPEAWTTPSDGIPPYQYNKSGTGTPLIFWNGPLYSKVTNPKPPENVYANFNNPSGKSIINNAAGTGLEPNNNAEYCLQFAFGGSDTWNDAAADALSYVKGYYVEYGGYPGDPNTNDLDASLSNATVKVPMPINVQYRSNIMENGNYKQMSSIGTTLDTVLYGAGNTPYTVSPLETPPDGYMFQGVQLIGTSADKALFNVDGNNQATGQFSANTQTVVFLYEAETPFSVSVNASDSKVYKPNWVPTTATVRASPLVKVEEIVQYIMVPTSDAEEFLSEAEFLAKAASLDPKYKGQMHRTESGTYNMYNLNDPNLNGVLDNCTLWVMAKGTKITNNSTVIAFDHYTFKNIYTPIDVFQEGKMTSGSALYGLTRVGVNDDTEAVYGLPLDLDQNIVLQPPLGYDEINVVHQDLGNLWDFNPALQGDVTPLVLNDPTFIGKVFDFYYNKNSDNWYSALFLFENENDPPDQLTSPQAIDDFIPYNGTDGISYLFGLDQYMPPTFPNYYPVGYRIENGPLVEMSVPLKYGEIVLPHNNANVTIVYRQEQIMIQEEFHLFQRNADGVEVDLGEIPGRSANVSYRTNGDTFTGKPPHFNGYVYRGYSEDEGVSYEEVNGYPPGSYDPYTSLVPHFPATHDTKIIYKYKIDTTQTGIADEDIQKITTSGVGIDSHGNVVDILYLDTEKIIYGTKYTPTPVGSPDGFGNPVVFVDKEDNHWILSTDPDLYSATPFNVTKDTAIRFYYYKDSSKNGKPDHLEANVTLQYNNKADGTSILDTKTDTEGTPTDSFSATAPKIAKFVAVGFVMYKEGESPGTPTFMDGEVHAEIPRLGEYNWIIGFLYEDDANENGIPDRNENNNHQGGGSRSNDGKGTRTESPIVLPTQSTPTQPATQPDATTAPKTDRTSTSRNNYSWATFEKPTEIFVDDMLIPLSSLVFNGPYLNGYPDKTIHPNGNLTRAEAAQIIYNLYGRPDEYAHLENPLPYTDIRSDAWYGKAVSFLTAYDFFKGYPDGTFRPNQPITRAELVLLLVKYNDIPVEVADETIFNDVDHHWAKPQINAAYNDNLLSGFADGSFKPDNFATRAEVVTMINAILERPDRWIGENHYTDLTENDWAYPKLMNAAYGYAED